jgi:MoaA/NifB/PqqE/SkfB family radical SAM enzyme
MTGDGPDASFQPVALRRWPRVVNLVHSSACNLRCTMCYAHGPLVTPATGEMPQPLFRRIVDEVAPHAEIISFTNFGEPWCDPRISERLAVLARHPGVALMFQTNGTLLDRDHLELLRDQPNPLRFTVSIDSLDPVVYASIRPPAELATVLRNVRNLKKIGRELNFEVAHLELNAVLMARTIALAPALIELAAAVGADAVRLAHVSAVHPSLGSESLYRFPVYTNRVLDRCRSLAAARGVMLACPPPFAVTEEEARRVRPNTTSCDLIDFMVQISPSGEVWPCCGNLPVIGRLDDGVSLDQVWGGLKHQQLRRALAAGKPIGACRTCRYLERLAPYLYDSALVGANIPPEGRCLDAEPDFEQLFPLQWLDDLPPERLRTALRTHLIEMTRTAPFPDAGRLWHQELAAAGRRWADRHGLLAANSRTGAVLRRGWRKVQHTVRRFEVK